MKTIYISLFCFIFIAVRAKSQTKYYIKPSSSGINNGSSWVNASNDLQIIIDNANYGDEIWVASGIYKPLRYPTGCTDCIGDRRSYAFILKNGVKVYGGFAGTELLLTQRNWLTNPTILSGDFTDNDNIIGSGSTLAILNNTENAYHVLISVSDSASTVFDGFFVLGGCANIPTTSNEFYTIETKQLYELSGGGLYNLASSPTISNTTFLGNYALSNGGGIHNESASPSITNCNFNKNAGSGGGIANIISSYPNIFNCTFTGNYSVYNGGGMLNDASSPNITNCSFIGNYAIGGGGIFFDGNSEPIFSTIFNCLFTENIASLSGGGIVNNAYSSPTISNCTFSANHALGVGEYQGGGGMWNNYLSSPNITNCVFNQNTGNCGGGMYNWYLTLNLANCIFIENHADSIGGGMYNRISSPIITNCTFSRNNATNTGGGIHNYTLSYPDYISSPTITNTIIWGNLAANSPSIYNNFGSVPIVSYSVIQGTSAYPGTSNINLDPLFVDAFDPDGADNIFRTADDGLSLQNSSPVINASNPNTITPTNDITGFTRIIPFDIGAYEYKTTVLPTEFLLLKGKSMGDYNLINWTLASETNCDHFEIERSSNANLFEKIGSLYGGENSQPFKSYEFLDLVPFKGINYYRLKMVGVDSRFKYSNIIAIKFTDIELVQLYPNPVTKELYIHTPVINQNINVKIMNSVGSIMFQKNNLKGSNFKFDLTNYVSGLYFIEIKLNNEIRIFKVIKK